MDTQRSAPGPRTRKDFPVGTRVWAKQMSIEMGRPVLATVVENGPMSEWYPEKIPAVPDGTQEIVYLHPYNVALEAEYDLIRNTKGISRG